MIAATTTQVSTKSYSICLAPRTCSNTPHSVPLATGSSLASLRLDRSETWSLSLSFIPGASRASFPLLSTLPHQTFPVLRQPQPHFAPLALHVALTLALYPRLTWKLNTLLYRTAQKPSAQTTIPREPDTARPKARSHDYKTCGAGDTHGPTPNSTTKRQNN